MLRKASRLKKSFSKMMKGRSDWYRRFEFVEDALVDAEARLFQMNISDLSLFPDIEGVAGYVRQKARLLWGENLSGKLVPSHPRAR